MIVGDATDRLRILSTVRRAAIVKRAGLPHSIRCGSALAEPAGGS